MRKRRIAIASLLKPVDDPRMYEKMGRTLADTAGFEVIIIGYPSRLPVNHPHIRFISLSRFNRIGMGRLLMPLKVLHLLLRTSPDLVIVNTYELLGIGLWVRVITAARLVYDIRENYSENVRHTTTVPTFLRKPVAWFIFAWQTLLTRYCDHIIVAEQVYGTELRFLKRVPFTVIENRAIPIAVSRPSPPEPGILNMLFTGTVAESTGVYKAVELVIRMAESLPRVQLHVVGRCASRKDLERLRRLGSHHPFLHFDIHQDPVPHSIIQEAIARADVGLICYPSSPHTANRIPTKLYEYMAQGLPFFLEAGLAAQIRVSEYAGAVIVQDINHVSGFEAVRLAQGLRRVSNVPPGALWQPEALLKVVKAVI